MRPSREGVTPPLKPNSRIKVLGVGNVLLSDEGIGVWVIQRLGTEYSFSQNVELYDGGTGGLGLLPVVQEADYLIVVDAVLVGAKPGTIVRFSVEDVPPGLTRKLSAHEMDMLEVLRIATLLGKRPPTVIVGIQPSDISSARAEPSDQSFVTRLTDAVIDELAALGIDTMPRGTAR